MLQYRRDPRKNHPNAPLERVAIQIGPSKRVHLTTKAPQRSATLLASSRRLSCFVPLMVVVVGVGRRRPSSGPAAPTKRLLNTLLNTVVAIISLESPGKA